MQEHLVLAFLIIGGIIGWGLFAFALMHLLRSRQKEITVINEIRADLKIVREEIKKLK